MTPERSSLKRFRPWFYAAAVYNLVWGTVTVLFPNLFFDLIGEPRPAVPALWQVVGMFVLVYAPAYWWAGRYPDRHPHLIMIGLLGKVLGPVGFAWAAFNGQLTLSFGLINLTNDLIWWPSFALYLITIARMYGGWRPLLWGEGS